MVLSGGEPLLLNDDLLWRILKGLRSVDSVKTLRVETRILSHLPQRVTESLVAALKDCGPVWFQAGVNHPEEITGEFAEAAAALADAGIPLLSETVLLKDINDRPRVLADLFSSLHRLRIRPAQLIHCLPVPGGDHLRTSVSAGLRLMQVLRGGLPEPSLPEYAAETFGGRIPLRGESVLSRTPRRVLLRNSDGRIYVYPEKFFSFSA
ncbi:MAG: hypothetical protein A2636_01350 [Elusimicrobia bacterium RIFCSPHIGHO2_01_FULL_64_10]|nr:MAG: hypothetical protein A2636_01350 [Elusimicrobia bacterium RIFCSPHIGHO2_01_FULL_64_10]